MSTLIYFDTSMYLSSIKGQSPHLKFQRHIFNFGPNWLTALFVYLSSICFRQEEGYCHIQYTPTTDPNSFKITGRFPMSKSTVGSIFCQGDYLFIPQGRNSDTEGFEDGVKNRTQTCFFFLFPLQICLGTD